MELKDIVKTAAYLAVIGVVAYAFIKDIDREQTEPRTDAKRKSDPFWDGVTERNRISALEDALARETDPAVRRELVRQLGRREGDSPLQQLLDDVVAHAEAV
jgi:hypothetical protein